MNIKTTVTTTTKEVECNADELRQSNTVSESILGAFRRAFNGPLVTEPEEESEEEE